MYINNSIMYLCNKSATFSLARYKSKSSILLRNVATCLENVLLHNDLAFCFLHLLLASWKKNEIKCGGSFVLLSSPRKSG